MYGEALQEVWTLKDPCHSREKMDDLEKKASFCLLSFLSMGRGLDPKLLVLFTLLISVPKIRSLFPHDSERITYSLWFSAGLFVYCYRQAEF